jgi:DNA invertase Pin-like site-specific DNA recombinase
MGRSWLAVQNPHDILSGGDCSDGERDKVYREKVSGAKTDRAELAKVTERLESGDVLLVTRLDRLARSIRDLLNVIEEVSKRASGR